MRIATLLTCHNRKDKSLYCLSALFTCPLPEKCDMDVYLVDDGSTDGTTDAIRAQFPAVNVIQGNGNLFWNRGMHLAWETAAKKGDYDYYLWLNDDTTLYPHAIQELITCSESEHDQSIICGSTCASQDLNRVTYGGRTAKSTLLTPNGQKQRCVQVNGNILLIPKHVYSIIGTNDPIFHHAMGDFDYGLRALKSGILSIVAPKFLGVCDEHKGFAAWCNTRTPFLKRLKLLYSPLGMHPIQFFIYEKRHFGYPIACVHFVSLHTRTLFPALWKNSSTGK